LQSIHLLVERLFGDDLAETGEDGDQARHLFGGSNILSDVVPSDLLEVGEKLLLIVLEDVDLEGEDVVVELRCKAEQLLGFGEVMFDELENGVSMRKADSEDEITSTAGRAGCERNVERESKLT
jgi:hypothetical protein